MVGPPLQQTFVGCSHHISPLRPESPQSFYTTHWNPLWQASSNEMIPREGRID